MEKELKSRRIFENIKHIFLQLLGYALFFVPLIYIKLGYAYPVSRKMQEVAAFSLMLIFYVLIVLPFKSYTYSFWYKSECFKPYPHKFSYFKRLLFSLKYCLVTLPFNLPLLAYLGAFYYLFNLAPFNLFGNLIAELGNMFGGSLILGGIIVFCLFIFPVLLFIWGRYRYLGLMYLSDEKLSFRKLLKFNKASLVIAGPSLSSAKMINFVSSVPPLAIALATVFIDIRPRLKMSLKTDVFTINNILKKFDFSDTALIALIVILVLLYLPFMFVRKKRLAKALAEHAS